MIRSMTSTRLQHALILAFACVPLACTKVDPLFCDEQTPCTDPDRPFCDLLGEYPASEGIGKTCIPTPDGADGDAGDSGGADEDAGSNESDADPDGEDAATVDASPPCNNWSAPVIVSSVNSTTFEGQASESPDRLSLYFTKTIVVAEDSDMLVATRSSPDEAFGTPSAVPGFDTDAVFEDAPELSPSGLELFFRRTAGGSGSAIFVATRETVDDNFGAPQSLGVDGFDPSISGDGLTLYFASLTGDTIRAMSRNAIGGVWGPPRDVMDTPYTGVDISGDELRILLSAGPANFDGGPPVVIAERASKDDSFGEPAPINALTLPDDEALSKAAAWADGERTIYLAMDLPTGQGATDIYFSTCE
jgi:hypothetical protein